jgi:hypothetical protein
MSFYESMDQEGLLCFFPPDFLVAPLTYLTQACCIHSFLHYLRDLTTVNFYDFAAQLKSGLRISFGMYHHGLHL